MVCVGIAANNFERLSRNDVLLNYFRGRMQDNTLSYYVIGESVRFGGRCCLRR